MEAMITCSKTWASSHGTLVSSQLRMGRSHVELLFHSRMWVEFRQTGTLRCLTTLRFRWNPGQTPALQARSKHLKRTSSTRKSLRSSQEEALSLQVNRWTCMCFTILRRYASTTSESSSRFITVSHWASSLRVRHFIDVLNFNWLSTRTICLPYLLVLSGPSLIQSRSRISELPSLITRLTWLS